MPLYRENDPSVLGNWDAHSNDFLLLIEKDNDPTLPYTWLAQFALSELETERDEALQDRKHVIRNGMLRTILKTTEPAFVTLYRATLALPAGNWFRTAISKQLKNGSGCLSHLYIANQCANDCDKLWFHFPEAMFFPPDIGALVTKDDDRALVTAESQIEFNDIFQGFYLKPTLVSTSTGAVSLSSILYTEPECADCDDCPCNSLVALGDEYGWITTEGGSSFTDVAATIPVGAIITDHIKVGEVIIATYADNLDPTTATTGGILLFTADGASVRDINLTAPLYSIVEGHDGTAAYWAGGAGNALYSSDDASTWTLFSLTDVITNEFHIYELAVDKSSKTLYMAGTDDDGVGGFAPQLVSLNGGVLDDITAELTGAGFAGDIVRRIALLDDHYVMVGGEDGTIYENAFIGLSKSNWRGVLIGSSASVTPIQRIVGDRVRQYVFAGSTAYERSPITNREFMSKPNPLNGAITGTFLDAAYCMNSPEMFDGVNYISAVTSAGELVRYAPCQSIC